MRRFAGWLAASLVLASTFVSAENVSQKYSRSDYTWPFARGPDYGETTTTQRPVRTVVGSFDLSRIGSEIPQALLAQPFSPDDATRRYFIAQRVETGDRRTVESLIESVGGQIVGALPIDAWLLRLTRSGLAALEASGEFEAIVAFPPALKLHPRIGQTAHPDPEQALATTYRLDVILWPGEPTDPVALAVRGLGGRTISAHRGQLVVEMSQAAMFELANLDAVRLIAEDLPIRLHGGPISTYAQSGTSARPFNAAGVDGGGIGGAGVCTISAGPCTDASDCNGVAGSPAIPPIRCCVDRRPTPRSFTRL